MIFFCIAKGLSAVCVCVCVCVHIPPLLCTLLFPLIENGSPASCSLSLVLASVALPARASSLFRRYPLYFLPAISIHHSYTHAHTHSHTDTLFPPFSSWLSPSISASVTQLRPPPLPPRTSLSEHISSKVSSQVTLALISLTAAKHRRLERTHCLSHTHMRVNTRWRTN